MPFAIGSETIKGMYHGWVAVSPETATRLTELTTISAKKGILIRNPDGMMIVSDDDSHGNAGPIFIGFSPAIMAVEWPITDAMIENGGIPLAPGEAITIPVKNPNDIWIIHAEDADQYISWATV